MKYDGMKVYMNGDYPCVFINNENIHLHKYIWEKYFGEIPQGCIIHHKDENKLNWDIDNLELLTRSEHLSKHRGVVRRKKHPMIAYKDGVRYEIDGVMATSEFTSVAPTSIYRILNGKQHQSNGWTFERGVLS